MFRCIVYDASFPCSPPSSTFSIVSVSLVPCSMKQMMKVNHSLCSCKDTTHLCMHTHTLADIERMKGGKEGGRGCILSRFLLSHYFLIYNDYVWRYLFPRFSLPLRNQGFLSGGGRGGNLPPLERSVPPLRV